MNYIESDVIVIGAGTAGCVAAFTAARKGLKTILIERKSRQLIGNKVCGDGVGIRHLDFLTSIGLETSEEKIVRSYPDVAQIVSPDKKTINTFDIPKKLVIINRYEFGQSLLQQALKMGIHLKERCTVRSVSWKNPYFEVRTNEDASVVKSKTIIDASGLNSWIREKSGYFPDIHLNWQDIYACYREILRVPKSNDVSAVKFDFSQEITQGGYIWNFDRGENECNVGLGIPRHRISSMSPREVYAKNIFGKMIAGDVLSGRGGMVPTRHPLVTPTHPQGIWLTGDAGLLVNPLHGGGIGASLFSGHQAAISAFNYIEADKSPWEYNLKLLDAYFKRFAILDFFRLLLHVVTDVELNRCFEEGLLPFFLLFHAKYDQLEFICNQYGSIWENESIKILQALPRHIKRINDLLKTYPTDFDSNVHEWTNEYEEVYKSFQQCK